MGDTIQPLETQETFVADGDAGDARAAPEQQIPAAPTTVTAESLKKDTPNVTTSEPVEPDQALVMLGFFEEATPKRSGC